MNKKQTTICGRLLFPLSEGECAVIARGGNLIRTSHVVEIIETTPEYSLFETMNSVYKVYLAPESGFASPTRAFAKCA